MLFQNVTPEIVQTATGEDSKVESGKKGEGGDEGENKEKDKAPGDPDPDPAPSGSTDPNVSILE